MGTEGEHPAVELTQERQPSRGGVHPPHTFPVARDLAQVDGHLAARVVIDQQIICAAGGDETVVLNTIIHNDALVGNSLEVGQREHQPLQVLHLVKARVTERLRPFLFTEIGWRKSLAIELHDGIIAVGMPAAACKYPSQSILRKITRYPVGSEYLCGGRYFFVASDCGDVFCHESGMRNPDDAILLYEGQEVWFSLGVDKRTGRNKGLDISLDDSLPSSLIKNRPNFDADVQPNARPISEFISENNDRIRKALHNVRFPMITLMQGARSLSAPDFPGQLRCVIQRACEILDECLTASNVTDAIKSEALQVVSYLECVFVLYLMR